MFRTRVCLGALATLALIAGIAPAQVIYANNFQSPVGPEWSATTTVTAPLAPTRQFLGEFGNGTISLTLSPSLFPAGPGVYSLGFDTMILRSWDGIGTNDNFIVRANGLDLLNTSFSNNSDPPFNRQRFSRANPNGDFAGLTDANEVNTLGFQFAGSTRDSVYYFQGGDRFQFNYDPISGPLTLSFLSTQDGGPVFDEGWGIDNVSVSVVPEPTSLLLVTCAAPVVLWRRRRLARVG
ncbi:MAG: hypothetical protein K1X57_06740 [Gemmataceae bacterium]|nr:hypothetical protein [Gemmataceae bacterium]